MALVSLAVGAARLEQLVSGLLFVSESDSPLRVLQLTVPELDEPRLLGALGKPADSPITRISLDELLGRAASDQPWHGPAERVTVERYRALLDFMSTALDASRVYRIGAIEVEAHALGKTSDGHWLGVATTLIET